MDIKQVIDDDDIQLSEMHPSEVEKTVKAFSPEGLELRAARRKVRYKLYRCRTESEGKGASGCDQEFKEKFESQDGFTGWRFFATNWDVALDDPCIVVSRDLSEQAEWDLVVRSKFPQIQPGGQIVYPDITVKKRVEAEAKKQKKRGK